MIGRDDLAAAVGLEEIAAALPERRYFLRCGRRALASRGNGELRRVRELHPAWRFPGPGRPSSSNGSAISTLMGSRRGRRPAAGRVGRETRDAMAVEHADEWPGAEVAIERERLRDGRSGFGIGPVAIANRAGLRSRRKAQTMSFIVQLLGLGKAAANGKLRTAADVERALGILVDERAVANKAIDAADDERRQMLLSMRATTRSPTSTGRRTR
jgi:hypothetical protein